MRACPITGRAKVTTPPDEELHGGVQPSPMDRAIGGTGRPSTTALKPREFFTPVALSHYSCFVVSRIQRLATRPQASSKHRASRPPANPLIAEGGGIEAHPPATAMHPQCSVSRLRSLAQNGCCGWRISSRHQRATRAGGPGCWDSAAGRGSRRTAFFVKQARWPIHLPPAHARRAALNASSSRRLFTSSRSTVLPSHPWAARGRPLRWSGPLVIRKLEA